jgi:hypothetical protein
LALEARRPYGDTSMPDGGLLLVQNAAVAIMLSRGVTLAMLFFFQVTHSAAMPRTRTRTRC